MSLDFNTIIDLNKGRDTKTPYAQGVRSLCFKYYALPQQYADADQGCVPCRS
jgi:hypothetical protein